MNPLPETHSLYALASTLLARTSVPLCPMQPYQKGLLAEATGGSDNVRALLHLLNDELDAAHLLVQPHEEDATANYIHQLVHRREGDWSNARYWVGKTGTHPFYAEFGNGTARERVDRCQRSDLDAAALSWKEMTGLLGWVIRNRA